MTASTPEAAPSTSQTLPASADPGRTRAGPRGPHAPRRGEAPPLHGEPERPLHPLLDGGRGASERLDRAQPREEALAVRVLDLEPRPPGNLEDAGPVPR